MTKKTDLEAANALVEVLGGSRWAAVALARGFLAAESGADAEAAARISFDAGLGTLKACRDLIRRSRTEGLLPLLTPREKMGSAENPVTKMFPATITEQRFLEVADRLCDTRKGLTYSDDRETGGLTDLTFREQDRELPVNIKNAGTRFEKAAQLVGLDPDDCVPIPAYKAHAAIESEPSLLYAVSVDYQLIRQLDNLLPNLFDAPEKIAWNLLNNYEGTRVRSAEDVFVFRVVRRHWDTIQRQVGNPPFHVVSARKAIRILQTNPHRTPGIGLRAWGTGAAAEVNVHVSISEDMKTWQEISQRISLKGLEDVIAAVNRRRMEMVYDPEI